MLKKSIQILGVLSLLYFIHLMILITWQYFPFDKNVLFFVLKDQNQLVHYQIAFFTHIYTSLIVLIIGFFQFFKKIRIFLKKIHQIIGKIYIVLVMFFAAPSGLILGIYGNGGFISKISFVLQAILWFIFTFLAFKHIKKRNYQKHFEFMIYSYALTLSAISLRIFKWFIVYFWKLPPMDTYKIVVWLGWIFNLLIAYFCLKNFNKKQTFN